MDKETTRRGQEWIAWVVLLIAIGFVATYRSHTPEPTAVVDLKPLATSTAPSASSEATGTAVAPAVTSMATSTDGIVLHGTFLGLFEDQNGDQMKYEYLLLDDGSEVLRIDLRPLISYSVRNVPEKLGIKRGQTIVVSGHMGDNGTFVVSSIRPAG